jgi:hypothetical protein
MCATALKVTAWRKNTTIYYTAKTAVLHYTCQEAVFKSAFIKALRSGKENTGISNKQINSLFLLCPVRNKTFEAASFQLHYM